MNLHQLLERRDRPFLSHPQIGRYFPAAAIEDARRRLGRSIERGDGPGIILGAAGSGKSLLLQVLAAQYREKFDVVLLACSQLCTRRALLQAIHFELGLDYRRRDEGQLRLSLLDQLLASDANVDGLLLLVDEAQVLPTRLLEELRLLTNLARNGLPRVRLVLAGLPSLEEKFAEPELEAFNQRITTRCCLAPFSREETSQYVRAQLAAVSASVEAGRFWATSASDAVFSATDGVPRLINQLCDRALMLADSREQQQCNAACVQDAWADLQQLPSMPSTNSAPLSQPSTAASVVEFGSLTDERCGSPTQLIKPVNSIVSATEEAYELMDLDDESAAAPVKKLSQPKIATTNPAVPPRPAPPKIVRPRPLHVPDAVDPFADSFEEEELVLDSFAGLTGIFHAHTPRVENRREPAFSRMVQCAIDSAKQTIVDESSGPPEQCDDTPSAPARDPGRPSLRIAFAADTADSPDEVVAKPTAKPRTLATPSSLPTSDKMPPVVPAPTPSQEQSARAVLVIEDEPAAATRPQSGVRREEYRQLFSRLMHGT